MKTYVLDTNIISYYLKGNEEIMSKFSIQRKSSSILIPPMAYYEAKRDLLYVNATKKLKVFEILYSKTGIDNIDKKTLDTAISIYIRLRKSGIIIDDADILIAAYCVQNNYTLVSNNMKHFEGIENLQVENWVV
jgi:predicted nucleic acid-binding protein